MQVKVHCMINVPIEIDDKFLALDTPWALNENERSGIIITDDLYYELRDSAFNNLPDTLKNFVRSPGNILSVTGQYLMLDF